MSYSAGMLDKRITIQNRKKAVNSELGIDGNGILWEDTACVWASVTWAKGARSLNAGALDAYAVKMVRMRFSRCVNMRSRVVYDGQVYAILPETFNADRQEDTVQFLMQAEVNDKPAPAPTPTPSTSNITGGSRSPSEIGG